MASNGNVVAIDRDVPDVDNGDALQAALPWAMVDVDPERELAKFEAAATLLEKLRPASVKVTKPQDWVQMGEKVYLQATGVERLTPLWGLAFGAPQVERVDHPDGHFDFVVTGPAGSRRTGVFYKSVTGGRSSRDRFFWPATEIDDAGLLRLVFYERDEKRLGDPFDPQKHIDSLDVRKAAVTNWQCRAAGMLTGLRGLTPQDLTGAGISGVARVEYGKGTKGGATVDTNTKADQTGMWNALLAEAGGDTERAKQLCRYVTSGDKPGKDGKVFPGWDTPERLTKDWQFNNARRKFAAFKEARAKGEDPLGWGDSAPENGNGGEPADPDGHYMG